MSPFRFCTLCAALNLGETDVARATGFARGTVRRWFAGTAAPWQPFAEWLEAVGPRVQRVLAEHPTPNRHRLAEPQPRARQPAPPRQPPQPAQQPPQVQPAAPAGAFAETLAAILSAPRLAETREERRAAIAAERARRQPEAAVLMVPLPERLQGTPRQASPASAEAVVLPRPPEAPRATEPENRPDLTTTPPAMCARCGRFYRTPTCTACEGPT
jgi:hypothetical protein